MRLLDAAARRRGLARRLGGELLARGLASGALACGLLGAGHDEEVIGCGNTSPMFNVSKSFQFDI